MNKKVLIIGGGVLLLGGVAYLYFKNKKKQDDLLANGVSGAGSTSATTEVGASQVNTQIPPLSTGGIVNSTTTIPTIQEQENLDKANDIAEQIRQKYKLSVFAQARVDSWKPSSMTFSFMKPSNPYPSQISKLKDDLLKLGYRFEGTTSGVLVKL